MRACLKGALGIVITLGVGCAGGPAYMVRADPQPRIQAPSDQALVVIMRPSAFGAQAIFQVVDGQGTYLGHLGPRQYFVHAVPAGEHTFVAWSGGTDMMQTQLQAGRVYYVLLGVHMGAWGAEVSISALTPRRSEWVNLEQWLADSEAMSLDASRMALEPPEPSQIQERLESAQGRWDDYDEAHRALRRFEPGDGMHPPPG